LPCLPRRTKPAVLPVLVLCVLGVLNSCRATAPEPEEPQIISGTLYQLQSGRFTPLPEGAQPSATPPQPWTVQQRVSDLTVLGERVYLGVNGYGITGLVLETDGKPDFNYFYDPLIFRYRTLTTLIPERGLDRGTGKDSLLCHLYFNGLLNVISQSQLKLQGLSLLWLDPASGIYSFVTPPYQEQYPEWEAVGFVPVTPVEFFIQWKYSDRNRTLFSYSRFDLRAAKEEEVEALAYRKSYGFEDARQNGVLGVLLAEARRRLDTPGISTAYQLQIRFEDQPLPRRYEYHAEDFASAEEIRLYTLCGVKRGESYLLLLPDGLLLQGSTGSRQLRRYRLPPLPDDFVYTELLLQGRILIAGWEQTAFTEVGASGIFLAGVALIP
jgi:hypothetical protein